MVFNNGEAESKITANSLGHHIKRVTYHDQVGFTPRTQGQVNTSKPIEVTPPTGRTRDKPDGGTV